MPPALLCFPSINEVPEFMIKKIPNKREMKLEKYSAKDNNLILRHSI